MGYQGKYINKCPVKAKINTCLIEDDLLPIIFNNNFDIKAIKLNNKYS